MKRPKEKQSSRSGNVTPIIPEISHAPTEPHDPVAASESLYDLVENAHVSMQHAVDATLHFSKEEIASTILVVLDGTSPIAPMSMRAQGHKVFGSNLVNRKILINAIKQANSALAKKLAEPASCGHLQYFVSTAMGGDIRCTECDLQLKPIIVAGAMAAAAKDSN